MDSYESTDSRYMQIRQARERRRGIRDDIDVPPYENFDTDDTPVKKGSLARVVAVQAVVCALLLGGLFLTQKALPNTYKQLCTAYTRVMRTDMSVKEVWAAAKAVFASLKEDIYVLAPYREDTTVPPATTVPAATVPAAGGLDVALEYANKNCSAAPMLATVPPYKPVARGELSSPFGYRVHPISGEEGVHTGMDVAADEGDPIAAAFFGTVLETGESKGYGKYVLMEHPNGLRTLYAHCSEIAAEEDMVLRPGETIAYVGSTGNSTGPHLHFEVRLRGLRCDPAPLFGDRMYPIKEEEQP